MSGNRWRWGGEAAGAAGGGGGAQYAYPVLAAAPRRMSATVSRCAVALRRTAAGPHGRSSTCPAHIARRCSPAPRAHPVCACALRARRSMPASARAALVRAPVLCVGCARAVCRRPATVGPDRARRHRVHPVSRANPRCHARSSALCACAVPASGPVLPRARARRDAGAHVRVVRARVPRVHALYVLCGACWGGVYVQGLAHVQLDIALVPLVAVVNIDSSLDRYVDTPRVFVVIYCSFSEIKSS